MRMIALSLAAPALLIAPAVFAGEPTEGEEKSEPKADSTKKICRYVTDGMGSRRKKRLCLTAQEWIEFNRGQ